MNSEEMNVIKRNGSQEPVQFDKVLERIRKAAVGLSVNYTRLAQLVLGEIHDGVRTTELDELAARLAISYMTTHPDWATLAAKIIISNCQRSAPASFSEAMSALGPALATDIQTFIQENAEILDAMVRPEHDFLLDYFGFKTLEKAYLMKGETPQYMWLRVAVGIHAGSTSPLVRIQETYDLMSAKAFTHATPTLFNAGTPRPQLSSCFLLAMKEDSIDGIFDTLKDCAQISKYAGGIGLHVHNIRAQGTPIAGTQGTSNGLVPMLRVFNNTARYVDQGGGKRNGSFAIYLEPWHADVQAFLKMKSNTGSEEERARDLFYALWVPDLFMKRVEAGADWSLFCPHEAPGLADVVGPQFEELYTRYEAEGRAKRTIPAQKLWSEILVSQIETGTPYLLYKDAANLKSNQKNLGTIKSSNLCVAPETILTVFNDENEEYDWHGIQMGAVCHDVPIYKLKDQQVKIWNGDRYSYVTVKQTGADQPLIRVILERKVYHTTKLPKMEFVQLDCTPYHKFILESDTFMKDAPRVEARDLIPGMHLRTWLDETNCMIKQRVVSVEDRGRRDDTYCFTEPHNKAGVFNGILTGNCTEIMEYSSPEETAVCNLASIALPYFLEDLEQDVVDTSGSTLPVSAKAFNFDKLRQVVAVIVRNLNRVIDINYYPTPETRRSNMRHRPIGIGIQGLADVFAILGIAWETPEAAALNQEIFEHIYYAALDMSVTLAAQDGPYESYEGSPMSQGLLQPDLWGLSQDLYRTSKSDMLDWPALRSRVKRHGIRNSLLLAPMPTASTSQILGYNECIEPFTTNIYVRRTLAGEFTVINRYLVTDLMALGLWTVQLKDRIVAANGSVQGIPEIPADLKERYKTVWEIKQKTLIDMAADRGQFICQSQSLNLFIQDPTIAKLSSMHFYAWKRGLKTGIYYLRTKSAVQAIKFTVEATAQKQTQKEPEECLLCSS
jgi:ribonucleotide reductase alpha subunit